jgi:hypothetical protein
MDAITVEKAAVGIVALIALNLVGKAALNLYKTFLRPGRDLKRVGKWAVITGATGKKCSLAHRSGSSPNPLQ